MENTSKRNNSLELVRFFAAILILIFHLNQLFFEENPFFEIIPLYVEFFFMVSGFFLMKHLESGNIEDETTWDYIIHKVRGFFAPLCIVNAVHLLLYAATNHVDSVIGVFKVLYHLKWEFFLLQDAGFVKDPQFNIDYLIGPAWYISAMIIALVFAYPLAKYYKRVYVSIICPLSIFLIYIGFLQNYGNLNIGTEFMFVMSDAVLRGFSGTCCGALCYEAYKYVCKKELFTRTSWKIIDVISWLVLPLTVVMFCFKYSDSDTFIMIPFGIIIISSMIGKTFIPNMLGKIPDVLTSFLGKISFYIYITQYTPIIFIKTYLPDLSSIEKAILSTIFCFLYSIVLFLIEKKRKNIYPVVAVCSIMIMACFGLACR